MAHKSEGWRWWPIGPVAPSYKAKSALRYRFESNGISIWALPLIGRRCYVSSEMSKVGGINSIKQRQIRKRNEGKLGKLLCIEMGPANMQYR